MNRIKIKKAVYVIMVTFVLSACLPIEYAGSDSRVKAAAGVLKAGSLAFVGACTKWIGTAELGAKTFLRFSGFDEVQASMKGANNTLEHRLTYYKKVLNEGYTGEEISIIGAKNQELLQKQNKFEEKYEAAKKLYQETDKQHIAQSQMTKMISLENKILEVEHEQAKNTFVINSHSRDMERAKTKEGRKEMSRYTLSLNKNISANETFESDALEATIKEVGTDLKDFAVAEVGGILTAGAVDEVAKSTGIMPQFNDIVSPENIAAAENFIGNVGSFVIQKTAETADVPIDPTLGVLPDALDDLFDGSAADVSTESDQTSEPAEQAPDPVVQEITDLLNEAKSGETLSEKESPETDISDVQSRVDARRQRRRRREKKDSQKEPSVDSNEKNEPVDAAEVTTETGGIDVSKLDPRDLLIEGSRRWNLAKERQDMEERRLEREQREAESRVYQAQQKQIQAQQAAAFFNALGAAAQLVQQVQAAKQSAHHSYGHSSCSRQVSSGHHDGGKVYKVVHTPGSSKVSYVRIK